MRAQCMRTKEFVERNNNGNKNDITSTEATDKLLQLIEELEGMDLYFHSSSIGWQNNTLDMEKELKTMETNGVGFVRMVDTAFNWFAEKPTGTVYSHIACITSIAGTKGLGQSHPTLPQSVFKATIWNVSANRQGCAILVLLPTYVQDSLGQTLLPTRVTLYSRRPKMWRQVS